MSNLRSLHLFSILAAVLLLAAPALAECPPDCAKECCVGKAADAEASAASADAKATDKSAATKKAVTKKAAAKTAVAKEGAAEAVPANQLVYNVSKMTCGGCVSKVQSVVAAMKLEGVSCDVSLEDEKAVLTLADDAKVDSEAIAKAITAAGFPAELQPDEEETPAEKKTEKKAPTKS